MIPCTMLQMTIRRVLVTMPALLLVGGLLAAEPTAGNQPPGPEHPAMMQETAQAVELNLKGYPGGEARVVVYLRGGKPYHGYVTYGAAANLPLPIMTAPPGGHGLYDAATGQETKYHPDLFLRYGYSKPGWQQTAKDYAEGKIIARRDTDPEPLTLGADSLTGTVDFTSMQTCMRISLTAKRSGDTISGTWEARPYQIWKDHRYGRDVTPTTGTLTARFIKDYWEPKPGAEMAKGKDWPQTHGPNLNMSAIDCGRPMIEKIEHARLVWVGEEPICGGKGNINKAAFGMGPLTPNDIGGGDYCAPVVHDGKVYLYYVMADFTRAMNDPKMKSDIQYIRGAPPGSVDLGHFVHRYLCADARTGKTLWRKDRYAFMKDGFRGEKQGVAQTPAMVEGVLVARQGGTLIGLDPTNGNELWNNDKAGDAGGYWSHENSVVGIGGVVVMGVNDGTCSGLAAFDPKIGKELWRLKRVRGFNQIPSQVILEGKPYILSALSQTDKSEPKAEDQRLVLIEPKTGTILWEDKTVGVQFSSMAVTGDIAALNVVPFDQIKHVYNSPLVGAYRITLKGAERLWASQQVN